MYCGSIKERVFFLPNKYDIVDNEVYLDCKNNLNAFIESGDYKYIDHILNEAYHVGSYGYNPKTGQGNALDYHKKRLELKRAGDQSGRKDAFWRDLISGTTTRLELDDMLPGFSDLSDNIATNFNQRMSQKHGYDQAPHENLNPNNRNSARYDLLSSIHKDLGSDFDSLSRRNKMDLDSFKELLKQPGIANKLSASTKSKILKFDKEYRAASREENTKYEKDAKNISDVVNPKEGERTKEIDNITAQSSETANQNINDAKKNLESIKNLQNEVKQEAENKPKSWLGKKVAALRKLYSEWLQKKNKEHDQKKIGFLSNILRIIGNCIDFLLKKLQNFAG